MQSSDRVLILDFGSQYTQLIARRVREQHVYCEIHPCTVEEGLIRDFQPRGIILSGGPSSVNEAGSPSVPPVVYSLDVPILGICYGLQAMTADLGGIVAASDTREFGRAMLTLEQRVGGGGDLFGRIEDPSFPSQVWMSHSDRIDTLADGFVLTALTDNGVPAAVAHTTRP